MRSHAVGVLVCLLVVLPTAALPAGPGIFLRGQPEDYVMIDKLQEFGLLPGLITGTRGLEAREVALEAGRFAVWYGPGRHGALLFTTNAEPLIGVRIRNPRPIAFPKAIGFSARSGRPTCGSSTAPPSAIRINPASGTNTTNIRTNTTGRSWATIWARTRRTSSSRPASF
jgi:hypothetical protein